MLWSTMDRIMPLKLERKLYKTVVRPAMMYDAETWDRRKKDKKRFDVSDMRMLRWMCGVTRKYKVKTEHTRRTVRVVSMSDIVTERLLKWFGHVRRYM